MPFFKTKYMVCSMPFTLDVAGITGWTSKVLPRSSIHYQQSTIIRVIVGNLTYFKMRNWQEMQTMVDKSSTLSIKYMVFLSEKEHSCIQKHWLLPVITWNLNKMENVFIATSLGKRSRQTLEPWFGRNYSRENLNQPVTPLGPQWIARLSKACARFNRMPLGAWFGHGWVDFPIKFKLLQQIWVDHFGEKLEFAPETNCNLQK